MKLRCFSNFNGNNGNVTPSFLLIKDENDENNVNESEDYGEDKETSGAGLFFPDFRNFLGKRN